MFAPIALQRRHTYILAGKVARTAMAELIQTIQREAVDENVPVSRLLRKVKLAASKLKVQVVQNWVEHELNGYEDNIPDYRTVRGRPLAANPYHGWIPMNGNAEFISIISIKKLNDPISKLESLIAPPPEEDTLYIVFPPHLTAELDKIFSVSWGRYSLAISSSEIVRILDRVRNMALDWALELDDQGIRGADFTFNDSERKRAQEAWTVTNNFGSFIGNFGAGNVTGDITATNISVEQVRSLVQQVRRYADTLAAEGVNPTDLKKIVDSIEAEASQGGSGPSRMHSLLTDLRNVVSGAAGNLTASGVIGLIDKILSGG